MGVGLYFVVKAINSVVYHYENELLKSQHVDEVNKYSAR